MLQIKGFAVDNALVSNTPNTVAQFGELSDLSLTFSTNKGYYTNNTYPSLVFTSFQAVDDSGNPVVVPPYVANHILAVASYLYGRYQASTITTAAALQTDVTTTFTAGTQTVTNAFVNNILVDNVHSSQKMPDYVSWTMVDTANGSVQNNLTVWFSDVAFGTQYDVYSLVVLPALVPVDQYNDTTANVATKLQAVTITQVNAQIAAVTSLHKPTFQITYQLQWQEPSNFGSQSQPTVWVILIYGPNGNTVDAINTAIQAYLANPANTALTTQQWQAIFPGIYEASDYFIMPLWDRIVSNTPPVLYSPISLAETLLTKAQNNVPFTALPAFWQANLVVLPTPYQQLGIEVIGSPSNSNQNDVNFAMKFSDYMALNPLDTNAQRMSDATRGFISLLLVLLAAAETTTVATPPATLPNGISKVMRSNKLYVTGVYEGTTYFVITKVQYVA